MLLMSYACMAYPQDHCCATKHVNSTHHRPSSATAKTTCSLAKVHLVKTCISYIQHSRNMLEHLDVLQRPSKHLCCTTAIWQGCANTSNISNGTCMQKGSHEIKGFTRLGPKHRDSNTCCSTLLRPHHSAAWSETRKLMRSRSRLTCPCCSQTSTLATGFSMYAWAKPLSMHYLVTGKLSQQSQVTPQQLSQDGLGILCYAFNTILATVLVTSHYRYNAQLPHMMPHACSQYSC